ncbi:NifB/NifX family molybdenum-iron cluster-binding protein [Methylomarinum sp. Ch1-1]|uniref:NifB/NifX family molybdenum-iron cluster-binding protein n=1 Tax=Methylomarinum roseum TaxID=3067653 RepID=A0AAU7NWA1_9GAMM|nr:NifB/NifX family molybdenum-iron cluster-binding protein [Methylomarinum sp. Ch1-1]MDP4522719.1 NifB/NifX family molybdenum-iron cluster-binding protein [Methylomarinum sp. Ch1-1]
MKIAVASQNKREITGHTGHCRKFWIYTIENAEVTEKSLLELDKAHCFHDLSPNDASPLDGVDLLIAGGMGEGLARRIEARNIKPFTTSEKSPDKAVALYLKGLLKQEPLQTQRHKAKSS